MNLYLEGELVDNNIKVNLESFIIYRVYLICNNNDIVLNILTKDDIKEPTFHLGKEQHFDLRKIKFEDVPDIVNYCVWPVIALNKKVVAGLCAVARELIKNSENDSIRSLLGFKESCLLSCAETSVWTKFCEIDVIETTKSVMLETDKYCKGDILLLPECLSRFDYHMKQPVRMHNVYKIAREKNNDKNLKSSISIQDLNLSHAYAEGLYKSLADVILSICFETIINKLNYKGIFEEIPYIKEWLDKMDVIQNQFYDNNNFKACTHKNFNKESLYSSDPNRSRAKNFNVNHASIRKVLETLDNLKIDTSNDFIPYGSDINFDWNEIPFQANPTCGALPIKRANRKCQQLENLAKAVAKICGNDSYKIVDFCSGGGHLGILLAVLLPKCKVVLVENKERSLKMAQERVSALKLMNVDVVQSNLDYFIGNFDVGVSLHACGVATDLVMQKSIDNKAHFVCCPCCYGSIANCHHLEYPRSKDYKIIIDYSDYLNVTHGSDQTHDKDNPKSEEGYLCMDIVDTDRLLYAQSFGYKVFLGKLQPTSCTPKNNLLVGIIEKEVNKIVTK